ncbi:MAG TPA: UDP-glucose 4-epimerase GalE, partial [Firmicutes bacterium]|nr:UDP-glucose 4-epimerase GalE [Bacillota bacterium]
LAAAERVVGRGIPARHAERRSGDPAVLVASSDRARQELGWVPCRASIADIISSAWKWHSAHPHGYANG